MQYTEQHRQGDCLRIPQVRYSSSVAYLVVNCIIPGLGTVISSWTDVEYPKWDWAVFITGLLQFGLAWIIIGWGWSIWWGVRMYQDAITRKDREESQRMANVINAGISAQTVTMDSQDPRDPRDPQDPLLATLPSESTNQQEREVEVPNAQQSNSTHVSISEDHASS